MTTTDRGFRQDIADAVLILPVAATFGLTFTELAASWPGDASTPIPSVLFRPIPSRPWPTSPESQRGSRCSRPAARPPRWITSSSSSPRPVATSSLPALASFPPRHHPYGRRGRHLRRTRWDCDASRRRTRYHAQHHQQCALGGRCLTALVALNDRLSKRHRGSTEAQSRQAGAMTEPLVRHSAARRCQHKTIHGPGPQQVDQLNATTFAAGVPHAPPSATGHGPTVRRPCHLVPREPRR